MTTYSNLPAKTKETKDEKVIKYFDNYYTIPIDLNVNDVDIMRGFFESKNFDRSSAENITYMILKTAKQSNYKTEEI